MKEEISFIGNRGLYLQDGNVIQFQLGTEFNPTDLLAIPAMLPSEQDQSWFGLNGYQMLSR